MHNAETVGVFGRLGSTTSEISVVETATKTIHSTKHKEPITFTVTGLGKIQPDKICKPVSECRHGE